jgi:hypothetical protein
VEIFVESLFSSSQGVEKMMFEANHAR